VIKTDGTALPVAEVGFKGARLVLAATIAGFLLLGVGMPKAEASSRRSTCFFDLRSARISSQCGQVIDHFYQYLQSVQPSKQLGIIGFATDYVRESNNVRLSMMRARAVARELERLGVPRGILYRQGFGSKDPIVPSAMQDPENRRVEMFIRPE
jgi:outer membrane protein OmpA-like peptidoglycan-associated protein